MNAILPPRVVAYLAECHVMTLATHGRDGPWAAAVFYVNDGAALYFLSSPTSRHSRNLTEIRRVAATIQRDYSDWREIKGVQLEGTASEVPAHERARVRELYSRKFPLVGGLAQLPAAIAEALDRVRWYAVVPQRMYFVDNSIAFGHRDEIDLSGTGDAARR